LAEERKRRQVWRMGMEMVMVMVMVKGMVMVKEMVKAEQWSLAWEWLVEEKMVQGSSMGQMIQSQQLGRQWVVGIQMR